MSAELRKKEKPSLISRMISAFGGTEQIEQQKSRLEAFLDAFPGEYCGLNKDGSVAYSEGFCALLDLENIRSIAEIQNALSPSDSAALEGMIDRLREHKIPFTITAKSLDNTKIFKFSGAQGTDIQGSEHYEVVWLEDITGQTQEQKDFAKQHETKESELAQVQIALNSIPRPLWLRDEEQNIVWCNATYTKYANMPADDVVTVQKELASSPSKKKTASNKPQYLPPGKTLAKKALKGGKAIDTKAHAILKGKRHLMRISEIPLQPLNMTLGIAYNVTREEDLENELKRNKSSNQELLEQLHSAIGIYNTGEQLEFYNSAFAQLWNLEDQWLNTKPKIGEIMEKLRETRRLPEQADFRNFKESWRRMFTGLIDPHEDMLYLPDGTALRMLAIPHSMGGLMMTFEDVTGRLELESSYNTLIAVQKETLDNLAEAVAAYGGDGRLKLWNPAFSRLWNLNPEDLEGEPHISQIVERTEGFFTEKEWPDRKEELIAKGLDRLMHEGRLILADKTLIDFITVPLPDGGVLITYSNVTDSVRVENALREKNIALETAEQLKLDFLANVSYQLRTPLNAIMGFTEILDKEYFGPLNDRQKEYTSDMSEASKRLLSLINDILDLSTLEAGYMHLNREDIQIHDMMTSVYDLVSDWGRKEQIEISLKCPKNIGKIMADERRLQQALINLIRNSINFTQSEGKIHIQVSRKKDELHITVEDTGIGISKEDRSRIFEPFERAQSDNQQNRLSRGGAGLGLSLVKNIITLHGGHVILESESGKGTIVTLVLPLTAQKTDLKLPIKKSGASL